MSVANTIFQSYKGVAEYFTPLLKSSQLNEKGVLTAEEFVAAGDLLVQKCPAWTWQPSPDPAKSQGYLPRDKQYLLIRAVPCLKRANALNVEGQEAEVEDDWLDTHTDRRGGDEEVADMADSSPVPQAPTKSAGAEAAAAGADDDDVPDMDEFDGTDNVVQDEAALPPTAPITGVLATRTYDLTITFDRFYSTPHVWLFGYNERNQPLQKEEIFEDIYSDYSNKTATIETHPYLGTPHVSIHPCRHAEVMKKMIDRLNEKARDAYEASEGEKRGEEAPTISMRADLYLFVFLKFIAAVIPTIEYDFTTSIDF